MDALYVGFTICQLDVRFHFLAYHNAEDMGYSCTTIPYPRVKTGSPVNGLEGETVWLIAGEGKSPKTYFLAAKFIVATCYPNKYPGERLSNEVNGTSGLFGDTRPIHNRGLIDWLKKDSNNFRNGLYQIRDPHLVPALNAIAK